MDYPLYDTDQSTNWLSGNQYSKWSSANWSNRTLDIRSKRYYCIRWPVIKSWPVIKAACYQIMTTSCFDIWLSKNIEAAGYQSCLFRWITLFLALISGRLVIGELLYKLKKNIQRKSVWVLKLPVDLFIICESNQIWLQDYLLVFHCIYGLDRGLKF